MTVDADSAAAFAGSTSATANSAAADAVATATWAAGAATAAFVLPLSGEFSLMSFILRMKV